MKVFFAFVTLFTVFEFSQAAIIVTGDITNYSRIDREAVFQVQDPEDYLTKSFIFPPKGPLYSNYIIKGIKQTDIGLNKPDVQILSGGIGSKHVHIKITSEYGKALATIFEFYGEKINY